MKPFEDLKMRANLINDAFRNIPDMENWYSKIIDKKDVTDPFVDVKLGK